MDGGEPVEREVYIVRDGRVVWCGVVGPTRGEAMSTRERFEEAWRRALAEGAVTAADAGVAQFRSYTPTPTVSSLRKVGLRLRSTAAA